MADKMIFPIGFDLETAVKEAQGNAPKLLRRLQTTLNSKPLAVNLKIPNAGTGSINEINARLKAIVKEWNSLAEAQRITNKTTGEYTVEAKKLLAEYTRLVGASNSYARTLKQIDAEAKKAAKAQEKLANKTKETSREFRKQDGYVSRLIKRLAVYAGFSAIGSFLTNVREITAQFELQRVSLGAIIQDQVRANALFSEIKSFALKSPVSILDLTKYTKQLAAYKIGVDELFETTKKLTDVSVGLGVSMERVVLAYGQTRATGYLRASEIRQFTEMGVPIVEELAAKLSKMNGELVTAAQVMDMVSKRGISFELVKQVFDDMTSAGGMFYNMQEKQGNTLFGLWAKLGDAASVMYDEIGNTDAVNSAMRSTIQLLTDTMRNWREVGRAILGAAAMFAAFKTGSAIIKMMSVDTIAAATASRQFTRATIQNRVAVAANNPVMQLYTNMLRRVALWNKKAALSTNIMTVAWNKLKVAMLSWGPMAIIAGIGLLINKLVSAHEKANRLKNTLKEIAEESGLEQMKSVRNFESLANAAVTAADGSKKQKDALDELVRTYKDIIPQERLTIENLREMKGNYDSLTDSIKTYVAEQMKQKQINAVVEQTGKTILDEQRKINAILSARGYADEQIGRFWSEYENLARTTTMSVADMMKEAWKRIGGDEEEAIRLFSIHTRKNTIELGAMLKDITKAYRDQEAQIARIEAQWDKTYFALGRYGNTYKKLAQRVKENPIEFGGSTEISEDKTPYLFKQQQQNLEILKVIIPTLQKIMSDAGVVWRDGWANIVETIDEAQPQIISSIDFKAIKAVFENLTPEQARTVNKLQELYMNIGIPEEVVRYNRKIAIDLANDMNEALSKIGNGSRTALDNVTKYFMQSGTSVNDYAKTLDDALKDLNARIAELEAIGLLMSPAARKELEDLKTAAEYVEKLRAAISTAVTSGTTRTSTTDPRLGILQEMVSTLKQVNKEYDELAKKEGATKALADTQRVYADTFKNMQQLAAKYKFELPDFGVPTDTASLIKYLDAIKSAMAKLPKSDKAVLALQVDIEKLNIDDMQKKIEQKLKDLSDKISRTKTAREFYDKILSQTGDVDLAANVTMSIYGSEDGDIQELLAQQIREYFGEYEVEIPVIAGTDKIDYKRVRELAKAALDAKKIGKDAYDALDKIATDGEKDLAKIAEQGAKLLLKYDEIAQQRVNIEQEASENIRQLREAEALFLASSASEEEKAAYKKRTDKAVAGVEADRDLKLLKLKDEYLRFFSAIHSLTNKEAETLRTQVRQALFKAFQSGAISADQLKKELKAVDEQFRKLKDDSGMAMDYLKGGFDGLIQRVRNTADELQSVAAEISKMESSDQISVGQKSFIDKVLGKFGNENTGKSFTDLFSKAKGDTAQMAGNLQNCAEGMEGMAEGAAGALAIVDMIIKAVNSTIRGIAQIRDQLNDMRSDDNQLGGAFWDSFEYLENFNKYAYSGWEKLKSGDVIGATADTVSSIISIFSTRQAQRVRRANKEIERQQELLDQLGYTSGRLEKAASKAFGVDYIRNYNQQLKNLQAQAEAYQKQAEAERSKGKKKDKKKITEYENQVRDTIDKINDMQSELVEHFTGTSLTDAARQMAKSWLEARASLSDTWAALKGDYSDMIKNFIVEGAAARIIEKALSPVWKQMDALLQENNIQGAIDALVGGMDQALDAANNGMDVLWKAMEARGYDMKKLISDTDTNYTGIAKNVAGATSEEINAVAAIGNTALYYLSPIPAIANDVAQLRASLIDGTLPGASDTAAGWTDWQQQAMDSYMAIQRNTADTVVECRRTAIACEAAVEKISRVMQTQGPVSGFNVFLH